MRISHVLVTLSVLLGPSSAASGAAVDDVPSDLVWFIDSEVVALGVGIRSGNLLSVAYSRVPRLVSIAHEEVR